MPPARRCQVSTEQAGVRHFTGFAVEETVDALDHFGGKVALFGQRLRAGKRLRTEKTGAAERGE